MYVPSFFGSARAYFELLRAREYNDAASGPGVPNTGVTDGIRLRSHAQPFGSRVSGGEKPGLYMHIAAWQNGKEQSEVRHRRTPPLDKNSRYETGALAEKQNAGLLTGVQHFSAAFGEARPNALNPTSRNRARSHGEQQVFRLTHGRCSLPRLQPTFSQTGRLQWRTFVPAVFTASVASLESRRRSRGFGYPFIFHQDLP